MQTRKKKFCKVCGKETYLWARGMCKYCSTKEKQAEKPSMADLFEKVLSERPLVSALSGKSLEPYMSNKSFRYSCCAHVLSRKKFPHLAYKTENIALITPQEHHLYDNGTIEQRQRYAAENNCDWNILETLKQAVLCL